MAPRPRVPSSRAVPLSLRTCLARALPTPCPCRPQPKSSSEPPVATPTRRPRPLVFARLLSGRAGCLCSATGAASPSDTQRGQQPGAEACGGISEGALALPPSSSYSLPSPSSKMLSGRSRKAAENYLLYPKLCRAKSQSPCSNWLAGQPVPRDPSGRCRRSAAPRQHGTGTASAGASPPSAPVRVSVCALGLSRC